MSSKLSIALIQADLFWRKPKSNIKLFENIISNHQKKTDLFILPEMFTTGFTMNPKEVAETMDGETINSIMKLSKTVNSAICGSLIIKEASCYYNRFIFIEPNGNIQFYDKRHTFSYVGEDKKYFSGKNKGIIKYKGWKICLRICYDLRFPVWSRNKENYDLIIYVANWPSPRINAWDKLLPARAIENCSYSIGVNCIGEDPNNNLYPGHSSVYDYFGNLISDKLSNKLSNINITIHRQSLLKYRKKFDFLKDQDNFELY